MKISGAPAERASRKQFALDLGVHSKVYRRPHDREHSAADGRLRVGQAGRCRPGHDPVLRQRLGLRLRDIKTLLEVRDTGTCPCEPAEALLRHRLGELDAELAKLTALRAELTSMLERLPSPDCPGPTPGTWTPQPAEEEVTSC